MGNDCNDSNNELRNVLRSYCNVIIRTTLRRICGVEYQSIAYVYLSKKMFNVVDDGNHERGGWGHRMNFQCLIVINF